MSYGIQPYAVLRADLDKALGSKSGRLLKKLKKRFAAELEEIDELDEEITPTADALMHLVMGDELDPDAGFKYGYALKFLCEYLGTFLPNREWSSMRWEWFEEVDGALAEVGVPEKVFRTQDHLALRGAPVELPEIDEFPSIGYLREGEIAEVALALEKVDVLKAEEDEEVVDAIKEIRGWLDTCARSHRDLICFYH